MSLNDEVKSLQLLVDIVESTYEESYPSEEIPQALETVKEMIKTKSLFADMVESL